MVEIVASGLVSAFSKSGRGGNPSFVIVTRHAEEKEISALCIDEAKRCRCETTHVSLPGKTGEPPMLRFYVAAGEIGFCGHGTLASAAFLNNLGLVQDSASFTSANGSITVQRTGGKTLYGFEEGAGVAAELSVSAQLAQSIGRSLGLSVGVVASCRALKGGAKRPKLLIHAPDKGSVGDIEVDPDARDALCRDTDVTGVYAFYVGDRRTIFSRHFPIDSGTHEDMATGNIAPTVVRYAFPDLKKGEVTILQGGRNFDVAKIAVLKTSGDSFQYLVAGECRIVSG